jgi:hypothetical protein
VGWARPNWQTSFIMWFILNLNLDAFFVVRKIHPEGPDITVL